MKDSAIARSVVVALTVFTASVTAHAQPQGASGADPEQVLKTTRPLADNGNANAQYNMGVLYDEGYGVEQDYARAREWYEKAAAQDYAKAEHNLGIMYQQGNGVSQDYAQAIEWFERAAEHGEPAAMNNLAVMYARGQGVDQDIQQAARWAARAAAEGNTAASNNLPQLAQNLPQTQIDASNVNIRSRPNTNGRVVRQADRNARVAILDTQGDWAEVLFRDDATVGWVAGFLLADDLESLSSGMASTPLPADQSGRSAGDTSDSSESGASMPQGVPEAGPIRYIGGDVVNVRSGPSTGNRVKFQAERNERVMVTGRERDWRRIRFDDGRNGWIAAFLLVE